mmetsp:Transcript_57887/g.95875  ORF Transcript_57887/g.95875 Transcript_57887/m.95875 type:complete len:644 (-) Transcript_57887:374-2305(-)
MKFIKLQLPIVDFIKNYDKQQVLYDLKAGIVTGVGFIPSALALAQLAGLPPVYGLYGCLMPVVSYALLGTCRELAVGPILILCMIVAEAQSVGAAHGLNALQSALVLSFWSGILQIALGVMGMGYVVSVISQAAVSGFCSAVGIMVMFSQAGLLLGLKVADSVVGAEVPHSSTHSPISHDAPQYAFPDGVVQAMENLINAFKDWDMGNIASIIMGGSVVVFLLHIKMYKGKALPEWLPLQLLPTAVCALVTWIWGFDTKEKGQIHVISTMPSGLQMLSLPQAELLAPFVGPVLMLASLGYMNGLSVSRSYARKGNYEVEAGQELVALGSANLVGSFFSAFPVTGGTYRTAVNAGAGAQTPLAGAYSACIMLLPIFLPQMLYYVPRPCLAAIIIVSALPLVDCQLALMLWKVKKEDFCVWVVSFICTLFVGVSEGLLIGAAVSWVLVVRASARPTEAILGRVPGTRFYKDTKDVPELEVFDKVLVWRYDARLYFVNAEHFSDTFLAHLGKHQPSFVVLCADGMNDIDGSGLQVLADIVGLLEEKKVFLALAGVHTKVMKVMQLHGLFEKLGSEHFFMDVDSAVRHCIAQDPACYVQPAEAAGIGQDPSVVTTELQEGLVLQDATGVVEWGYQKRSVQTFPDSFV